MPIDSHLTYLEKNAFLPPQISTPPGARLGIVVVIPCFDEPDLISSLQSLADCQDPGCEVEVITVINSGIQHPESIRIHNRETHRLAEAFAAQSHPGWIKFFQILVEDLPKKHAGVGLARKIGMDEATRRFEALDRDGVILCYDADSNCDRNYLTEVRNHFRERPEIATASLHFEHPLTGDLPEEVYTGIARYELYLRYYVQGLRLAGHPHAFHCIGSSMAVRSHGYQGMGGMNRRKAGEDFYFLQKFIQVGRHSELNGTRVIPSPRASHRVPFGTGKAISAWLETSETSYPVYGFAAFLQLKELLDRVGECYQAGEEDLNQLLNQLPDGVRGYLQSKDFIRNTLEVNRNTTQLASFYKRFFRWFDGLKVLQYFHYCRDAGLADQPVEAAAKDLLAVISPEHSGDGVNELLRIFRELDRKGFSVPDQQLLR